MERIRSKLVDVLWLHAFEINCKDLKRHLLSNAKSMQRLLLRKVNSDMSSHCKSMVTRFGEFYDVLNTWPKNIEAFDKLKQFLEAFESTHSDAVAAVAIVEDHLTGLEQRKYDVLQHDYNLYWESRRWPYLLGEAKNRVNESMPKFQKRFENELGMQKRVFLEEIERLRVDFIGMHAKGVGQWREAEAVCDEISLLEDRLDGAIEESELIRSRESVLGFDHEDFNQAIEMREGLKPFHELWSKVQEWEQQLPEWMDGPFSMIDSENASEFVRQCWRDMYRLQRVFDQNKKYSES